MEQKREYSSKGESLNKRVKWLLLSALTTTDLLLAVADASCDVMGSSNSSCWFHLLPTTPSDRRFRYCNETKQVWLCHYERFFNCNQLWLWTEICLLSKMFVCCAGDHPAPRQCGHQHQPGSGVPLLVRALWKWSREYSYDGWRSCSGASAAWSGPRIGTSQSSRELPALPSKWPERYHAVMISGRAVRTPTR